MRMSTSAAPTELGRSLLIVSERVPNGSQPHFLALHREVPEPRFAIAAASCPAAAPFWDSLPGGWLDVREVIPVDGAIDECITGHPEQLMVTVLSAVVGGATQKPAQTGGNPGRHLSTTPLSGAGTPG